MQNSPTSAFDREEVWEELSHHRKYPASLKYSSIILASCLERQGFGAVVRGCGKGRVAPLAGRRAGLDAEVLLLPHHGAASSLDTDLYDRVQPQLALASCGYANQWGFPSKAVREALGQRGIPLETTADRGQIVVEWLGDGPFSTRFARMQ